MNVPTITMDRHEARTAFLAYRKAVRERHTKEDEAIMRGYRALSVGQQVLNVREALKAAGADEKNRPKLAICRSDGRWCRYRAWSEPTFVMDDTPFGWGRPARTKRLKFPIDTLPRLTSDLRALVPPIPPALRPAGDLAKFFTLWEAEWQPVPPVDPMLLKHLGGELYIVLATWDLTELERAVLAGRFTEQPR